MKPNIQIYPLKTMKAWHFVKQDRRLGYEDNRIVKTGRTYKVSKNKPLELCLYGLHGSKRIIDALKWAPGPVVCRVDLLGEILLHDTDKSVAYERRVLWMYDATMILRKFARLCALDVINLWDAPDVVVEYLKTGDESIRASARASAWESAWESARASARESARESAWASAREPAWESARASARASAWESARESAREKQNKRLTAMIHKGHKK